MASPSIISCKRKAFGTVLCTICREYTNTERMFTVDGCLHQYCISCMKKHIEVKLLNGMKASCPFVGCKCEVSIEKCGKFLDPKFIDIINQRKKEASIPVTEKVYCPYKRCSALMSKTEVLAYNKGLGLSTVGQKIQTGARNCVKCGLLFCINCKAPWHENITCDAYKSYCRPAEDTRLDSLAKEKLWSQCPMCGHMVELVQGCFHITCRCSNEFCYKCGGQWKNKKPTCGCNRWDEGYIIGN